MRRVSLKRARRNREAQPVRDELQIGRCEWCNSDQPTELHELANGPVRQECLDQPYALLRICRDCHRELHRFPKDAAVSIGLALIRFRRPQDYSLSMFYELTKRRWPDPEIVEHWWRRMLTVRFQNP